MTSKANLPSARFNSTGKLIRFAPNVEPQIAVLKRAAKAGYYYPMLALKQLQSLSSGPSGKHNVFIPGFNDSRAHTLQMFHMYVPGIKATIERRSNDTYTVTSLELDPTTYQQITKQDRPGVYAVSKQPNGRYQTDYRSNGRVTAEDNRVVVICDGNYKNSTTAAADISTKLKSMGAEQAAALGSFDIFYPGKVGNLGGFRTYESTKNTQSFGAANLLANAMESSRGRKGVYWLAAFGGSAVLSQSMEILVRQNIKLDKHLAKLYKPTTSSTQAVRFAQQLGMKLPIEFSKAGGIRASASVMRANAIRAMSKDDPYTWANYANDTARGGMLGVGLVGAALFVATLPATSGGLGIAAAITSGTGSAQLLWLTAKNWFEKPKNK